MLRVLFDELSRADRLAQEARKDAIKLIADFSGLDAGVVSLFIQRRPHRLWMCLAPPPWPTSSVWPMRFSSSVSSPNP